MKRGASEVCVFAALMALVAGTAGCHEKQADAAAEAPPPAKVVPDVNVASWAVDDPSKYPLVAATEYDAFPTLSVTGTVNPDIEKTVPVISLATGRVVEIKARLGDEVRKGQVLLRVQSDDISGGFAAYQSAVADEVLAKAQWDRAQELYQHGAIALNDLQVAKDTEDKAKIAVDVAAEHVRLLGGSTDHPSGIVNLIAPISGVITDQEVTNAGGIQSLGTNPFTISDLSSVWIICDVYENDIPDVKVGDSATINLNAFPGMALKGTVSNVGAILDPTIRTAKVRIEVKNPGVLRVGMFATATFEGRKKEVHTAVPASAIMRLHDRDWVYVPAPDNRFQRVEIVAGDSLPGNMQEVKSGLQPGQKVVLNPVSLENIIENE
ncbi:MAG: efflux RND transporter periplasmic adaptor subunit [Terriglobales bacterium]|jgi:cobalt-zinc-cadmium efflux system membrane fusion protein